MYTTGNLISFMKMKEAGERMKIRKLKFKEKCLFVMYQELETKGETHPQCYMYTPRLLGNASFVGQPQLHDRMQ